MGAFFHSPRGFWSAALIAAAVVLAGSVELGKVVGATLLARSTARPAAVPVLAPMSAVSEVLGGQTHAAAAPGLSSPIWPSATPRQPANAPVPAGETNARTTPARQAAAQAPRNGQAARAAPRAPALSKPQSRHVQSQRHAPVSLTRSAAPAGNPVPASSTDPAGNPRPSVPRPALTPIAQITPPDQNLGY